VTKREEEIKNMAATYKEIAEQILPQLRRSEMKLNYQRVGKTDAQLTEMSRTMPDSLNVEELLFAATLTSGPQRAAPHLQGDRACTRNGLPRCQQRGLRVHDAEQDGRSRSRSSRRRTPSSENPVSTNNLGVVARLKGDRKKAAELYTKAMTAAGPEVKYNKGLLNIQNGDYSAANTNMAGAKSFNSPHWPKCSVAMLPVHKASSMVAVIRTAPWATTSPPSSQPAKATATVFAATSAWPSKRTAACARRP
jgi:hypothetical protein